MAGSQVVVGGRERGQRRAFDLTALALLRSCPSVIRGVGAAAVEVSIAGTAAQAEASVAERDGCRIRRALLPWL